MNKICKGESWDSAFEEYKKSVENLSDDDIVEALDFMLKLKAKRDKSHLEEHQKKE